MMAAGSSVRLLLRPSLFVGDPSPLIGFWVLTTRGPSGQEIERRNRPTLVRSVTQASLARWTSHVPPMDLACT